MITSLLARPLLVPAGRDDRREVLVEAHGVAAAADALGEASPHHDAVGFEDAGVGEHRDGMPAGPGEQPVPAGEPDALGDAPADEREAGAVFWVGLTG